MKRALIVAGVVALTTLPAQAADPRVGSRIASPQQVSEQPFNWTGIYVGVGGGYQLGVSEVSFGPVNIDSASLQGFAGDARVGIDWHVSNTPFVFGLLGQYSLGKSEFDVNLTGTGSVLNADIEQTWALGGRVGLSYGRTLAYVGYAYTQAEFNIGGLAIAPLCTAGTLACGHTIDGHMFLAGLETAILPQITLSAEYNYIQYDSVNVVPVGTPVNIDTDVHSFKARLNYRPLGGFFNQ